MDRPTAAAGITPGSQIMCAFKLLAGRDGSADRPVDRPMDHTPSGGCSANANRSALRLVRRGPIRSAASLFTLTHHCVRPRAAVAG